MSSRAVWAGVLRPLCSSGGQCCLPLHQCQQLVFMRMAPSIPTALRRPQHGAHRGGCSAGAQARPAASPPAECTGASSRHSGCSGDGGGRGQRRALRWSRSPFTVTIIGHDKHHSTEPQKAAHRPAEGRHCNLAACDSRRGSAGSGGMGPLPHRLLRPTMPDTL